MNVAQQINHLLKMMFPNGANLHEPFFIGNEWNYVKECIDTRWVSSVGKFVDRFEKDLADYTGSKRAVLVVNGTAALQICLKLAEVKQNDEVLIPALTFIATANAVAYLGATPHLVDSNEKCLGVDASRLNEYLAQISEIKNGECYNKNTGHRIRALVPMHTFGHPVDLDAIAEVCERYKLVLIEDAAESLGSYYSGKHTGNWGKLSALSFNGNKIVTTGGGGAVLTNDENLGKFIKHLTTTAKVSHPWEFIHDQIGYNFRMPNLNAALGCAQLEKITKFLAQKRRIAEKYDEAFKNISGLKFVREPDYGKSNYWLNTILLDETQAAAKDEILKLNHEQKIFTRPAWKLMHHLEMYKNCPRMDLSVAESLEKRLICLPSSAFLLEGESK